MTESAVGGTPDVDPVEVLEVVACRVGESWYGLEVGRVRQVDDCPPTTRVPRTAPAVRGVASVAGEVTVVVDARVALDSSPDDGSDRLVVLDRGDQPQPVALLVDAVADIERCPVETLGRPGPDDTGWAKAVADRESGPLTVLSVERIAETVSTANTRGHGDFK
ncbi:chemotaxis protein CheW [Halomarina litorea]|uniref:chemotaxis protein CheW n=1 Tax=Halomarina litorea TaxID=2961595 RepID=UPI0020C1DFF2|nr:chemotaxis protein CheW [Halomarina sp. BCD28]